MASKPDQLRSSQSASSSICALETGGCSGASGAGGSGAGGNGAGGKEGCGGIATGGGGNIGVSPAGGGGITGTSAGVGGSGSGGSVGVGASTEIGGPLLTAGAADEGGGKVVEVATICGAVSEEGRALSLIHI